jgi:hypothetical protein
MKLPIRLKETETRNCTMRAAFTVSKCVIVLSG